MTDIAEGFNRFFVSCTQELQSCAQYVNKYLTGEDKENANSNLLDQAAKYGLVKHDFEISCNNLKATANHFGKSNNTQDSDGEDGSHDEIIEGDVETYYRNLEDAAERNYNPQSNAVYKAISKVCKSKQNRKNSFNSDASLVEVPEPSFSQRKSMVYTAVGNDNSVLASQDFSVPLDPLTKQPICNPCRNTVCNHVYEYDVILKHIAIEQKKNKKCKCPYIGCNNANMQRKDIVKDDDLLSQIETHNTE